VILLVSVLHIYWNAHNFFCKCVWYILNRKTALSLIFYILERSYIGGGGRIMELCLRVCATIWKVVVSIPDGVFGIFYWHIPSGPTNTLVSSQPLKEMSTRNISCMVLTILPPSCGHCLEIWEPQLLGTLKACTKIDLLHFYRVHIKSDIIFVAVRTSVCLSCMKQYCQQIPRKKNSKYLNSSLNKDGVMDHYHLL
jgi:hypothetical protein